MKYVGLFLQFSKCLFYLHQAEETEPFYNSQNTLNLIYNILILIYPREFKVI